MNRRVMLIAILLSAGACLPACKKAGPPPTEQQRHQAAADKRARLSAGADDIAGTIIYLREPRAGLCFAYLWESYGYSEYQVGGPSLATVDCDKVAPFIANAPPTPEAPAAPTPPQTAP